MSAEDPTSPAVSVIVPTRNNVRTLDACLRSVREQTYPQIELIVVDNHSTDQTVAIAQKYADSVLVAGPERSAQRNLGIESAAGEWILWLDSDMVLPPEAIAVAVATALTTGAHGVALPERTIGDGFWTRCRALERACYLTEPLLHNPRLLRRDYLLDGGGFDLSMSGPEDADLRLRMRGRGDRIELAPIVIDHDEGHLTVREVLSKRFYYGRSIPSFAERHSHAVSRQSRDVALAYARNSRLLLADPVHAVGMLGLRGLEAAAYLAGAYRGRQERAGSSLRRTRDAPGAGPPRG